LTISDSVVGGVGIVCVGAVVAVSGGEEYDETPYDAILLVWLLWLLEDEFDAGLVQLFGCP